MGEKNEYIHLPSMGEGITEAVFTCWLKKKGDRIKKDDPIAQISTDKVDTEIISPFDGYLIATFCKADDIVEVDTPIAQLSNNKNSTKILPALQNLCSKKENRKLKNTPHDKTENISYQANSGSYISEVRSSPIVKEIAREKRINLHKVIGSGLYGRITKDDILSYLTNYEITPETTNKDSNKNSENIYKLTTTIKNKQEYLEGVVVKRKSMSKIRALTAKHMLLSVKRSPHATTIFEVSLDNIIKYKEDKQESIKEKHAIKLSFTPFFIEAAINSLKKHPKLNCSVDNFDILYKEDINIGCAVATSKGLIVPVIKKTNSMNLITIVKELNTLVKKARESKLHPSDIVGGSFSITNPGMYGCSHSQPIINQPQVAIMSIGNISKKLVFDQNQNIKEISICNIGITFDHRIIDGEDAVLFLKEIKKFLENYN
jgi:pyruvate/2-oxoglutarate dehydrogenase complex dihydrolipoamide acyltransferase (E2) component